jgi:UDP-glucose 4-epimerase
VRVLVTGGAGFLGRHFTRHHLEMGDDVIVVDDMSAQDPRDVPHDVLDVTEIWDIIEWMRGPAFLNRDQEEFDLAYHFAAPVGGRLKIERDPLFNAHSLAIDAEFFRWAHQHVKRVVYPSSSAVYARIYQGEEGIPLKEDTFHPDSHGWGTPDEMYGFTKLAGEVLAWKAAQYGLNTLCLRPFSGYGEGQSFDYPVPSIAARALRKENPLVVWGSGRQSRDFIHVEDLVKGTLARLDYPVKGYDAMNLGNGLPITFATVAELFAQEVGYTPVIQTDESKPEGVTRRYADVERMWTYYQPKISLKEGLRRVLADVELRIGVATLEA